MRIVGVILLIVLAGWLALITSSYGLLIRADPMYLNPPNVIEDMACIYFTGVGTETVILTGQKKGATCQRLHRFP
jgi:hypothetical protein